MDHQLNDRTLKAFSVLLSYPTQELQQAMPEIGGVLASETRLTAAARRDLRPLIEELGARDIYALEEDYVMLFDRSRSLSLNLFEHVHGESRDRGGAMVDLLETYRAAGFEPATTELPDHLPVLLEFLAARPPEEARDMLADAAHILAAVGERLGKRESAYAAIFTALVQMSGEMADEEAVAEILARPDPSPDDLEEIDKIWEETEVTFGPDPNAGCPQVRDMLAQMDPPKLRHAKTAAE
ncbi:nitrate reductase molybdenum cofactor assembly chaperone [Thioclava sediminum]|uniref:Nitrate reductase molybdenum cofactor assembly chaperone n=1 Tax=Thioclava sediminum TaxID=1915319 RepID=A0ABX3MXU1_9RHOB|nr:MULTISPECIES: nitrate reductase molybdenum cofactor assembly chaperone [Thioclava]OOY17000.1 nitrate reductase molybdenum cofactor assembly chaperone [Thioclava sp. DLFJ4-1]OOY24456.1 nitrate reductase molybdenum cofactor assembly chaperone [Thioclava sediminum]OOY31854.1 nitrate reductase molybdenum cofactor assembly chaperone [Thioclava sp. F36-6]OWY03379.1 nitrate reductase molybdenum cofactor assembly chaperone [Thioclava sp. IC9]